MLLISQPPRTMLFGSTMGRISLKVMYTSFPSSPVPSFSVEAWTRDPK
ncbi:MAG: hypothetical protein BJ554DRAFT_4671, partial [Olpidium bornovanus]